MRLTSFWLLRVRPCTCLNYEILSIKSTHKIRGEEVTAVTKNCASTAGSREYNDGAGLPSEESSTSAAEFEEFILLSMVSRTQTLT